MKYTIDEAMQYSKSNKIDKWLQSFLRDNSYENSNPNLALADGFYLGPLLFNLDKIMPKRIESDLQGNELKYYEEYVII